MWWVVLSIRVTRLVMSKPSYLSLDAEVSLFSDYLKCIQFRARVSNHIHINIWDLIIHPCPNVNDSLVKTQRGRITHIYVNKSTIIGSDNGLSPGLRQSIIWTSAGVLLIRTSWPNFSEILCEIQTFLFIKMHFKIPSQPQCIKLPLHGEVIASVHMFCLLYG